MKRKKGKELDSRTGNEIGEEEEKDQDGKRDWREGRERYLREGREKGLVRRKEIEIEEKDGIRD